MIGGNKKGGGKNRLRIPAPTSPPPSSKSKRSHYEEVGGRNGRIFMAELNHLDIHSAGKGIP